MYKITTVVGARPQFIKNAPIEMAIAAHPEFESISIHTGQHYDSNMSQVFFDELNMKKPDHMLAVGSGSHGKQTAEMLDKIEQILLENKTDVVLIYGDTNSTLAAAIAASKIHIPIAHVEAGLRSFNRKMPEEVNRVLADHISKWLLVPSDTGIQNLKNEGIENGVHRCGDVMADMMRIAKDNDIMNKGDDYNNFYYVTLHRPYNTDEPQRLASILEELNNLDFPVVFSRHPRTKHLMQKNGQNDDQFSNIKFIEPCSYFQNVNYLYNAKAIITDSGGLQKEAYMVKKQCITVRSETEWTETLEHQWNQLEFDPSKIKEKLQTATGTYVEGMYGSGYAAEEILEIILKDLQS